MVLKLNSFEAINVKRIAKKRIKNFMEDQNYSENRNGTGKARVSSQQ
jgi:hypothetical protein